MERVAVDIMGPFPRTDKGNRYVLAAMDYFTKWPEAYAIPDQEAETVANALVEGMFTRFGTAEGQLCRIPPHAHLPCSCWGESCGHQQRWLLADHPDTPRVPPGPEYVRRLQDRMESAHAFARNQLQKAGVRQKRNYDIRARGTDFKAGDLVWVYSPRRRKGRCPKLDCHWVGPCEVLEKLGEVVYRVQLPPRGRRVALHRDRLYKSLKDFLNLKLTSSSGQSHHGTNKYRHSQRLHVQPQNKRNTSSYIQLLYIIIVQKKGNWKKVGIFMFDTKFVKYKKWKDFIRQDQPPELYRFGLRRRLQHYRTALSALTDWEVFKEGTDLDGYTSSVLSYLKFCTDAVLPTKTIKVFPNQSNYMAGQHSEAPTQSLCDAAYRSGDKLAYSIARKELKKGIKLAKSRTR
ncbi:hypothetical protein L3Q82_003801 [Scortum barcoo]|uniref:Uncharacterized protein n=1 Tax=Scortum barcoo TaxID=214431 RepID=A0ACB8X610_9TELE|nr:hypothetical protein L3Q82_003801 [Scortum barcoo]